MRIAKRKNPKPLTVSFHLSQSNLHRRSDYCSALSRIAATDASVLSSSQSVTYHAISKFREELLKSRYRYIEKVTGNHFLLLKINVSLFYNVCQRGAIYPKNRKSSEIEVKQIVISSPNSNRTQTLVVFFFIVADLFFRLLYIFIRSIISFTD